MSKVCDWSQTCFFSIAPAMYYLRNMRPEERRKFIPTPYRDSVEELSSKILGLWSNEPTAFLTHREITTKLEATGVPKRRILRGIKRLLHEKKLENQQKGTTSHYRPIYKLKEFDTLQYLFELNSSVSGKGMVYDWGVGGGISHTASGTIIGFPPVERDKLRPDEKLALDTIMVRVSELYSALMELRDVLIIRKVGCDVGFSDNLMRQVILECHSRLIDRTMGPTDILRVHLSSSLGEWSEAVASMCAENKVGSSDPAQPEDTPLSFTLLQPFDRLLEVKKHLLKEGFDVDHYTLADLADRLRRMQEKTDLEMDRTLERLKKEHPKEMMISAKIPEKLSSDLQLLRRAYAVRLAEEFSKVGLGELQDMALVITRHPNTMENQMTTERMVSEFIGMIREFEQEKIAGLSEEGLAKFLGHELGDVYYRFPPDEVNALKDKPWLTQELGPYTPAFLDEYNAARTARIKAEGKIDRKKSWFEGLKGIKPPTRSELRKFNLEHANDTDRRN